MTIAATSRMDYVGSNTLATYAFTYPIVAASDLLVTKRDTSGVETTLALNTDYTVFGAGVATGGSITLLAGNLPTSYALTIRRVVSLAQAVDIRNQSGFFPEVIENEFDKLASADQQLNDGVTRSLRAAETDPVVNRLPAIAQRLGKFLAFDASGNPTVSSGSGGGDASLRADLAAASGMTLIGGLPVVSPKTYSAIGDGASNDSTPFTNMLAAVPDGTCIDLGGKSYRLASAVIFAPKSLTFQRGTIIIDNVNAGGQFQCKVATGIETIIFRDIVFKGTPFRQSNSGGSDNVNKWCDLRLFRRVRFERCTFTTVGYTTTNLSSGAQAFLVLTGNVEVEFDGCRLVSIDSDGIAILGSQSGTTPVGIVRLTNNYIYQPSGLTYGASGFNVECVKELVFAGNYTYNQTTTTSSGHNFNALQVAVGNNVFDTCIKGFDLECGAANQPGFVQFMKQASVTGNVFLDCTYGFISSQETGDLTHASTLYTAEGLSITGNTFVVQTAVASSYGFQARMGRATAIVGNTFSKLTNGFLLEFSDSLPTDPNGGAARSPDLAAGYHVTVSGNLFDQIGVSSGSYGVAMLWTDIYDSASGLSRLDVTIDGNTFDVYSSAATDAVLLLSVGTVNDLRMPLVFSNNRFTNVKSLVSMTGTKNFVGPLDVRGNTIVTGVASAQIVSTFDENPLRLVPSRIRFESNDVTFFGTSQCLVLNEQTATRGSGPTVYEFINNTVDLLSGFTDATSISPLLHNGMQAANLYSVLFNGNRIRNVSAVAGAIVGIYANQPQIALVRNNIVQDCIRGINVGSWNALALQDNVVIGATTFAYSVGAHSGTGTIFSARSQGNQCWGAALDKGFDYSAMGATEKFFSSQDLCLGAATFTHSFGSLPLSQIVNAQNAVGQGTAEGVTGAIATGTTVTHNMGSTPTLVLVTAQDTGPTNIYVDTIGATTFKINYGGGGSHVFGWRAVKV